MTDRRTSGILLHPTSLPGPYGIGELGPQAIQFLDFLAATHQQWWQVLPLGPTGYGDSPYQSFSAFAGNPLLISIQQLLAQGLLFEDDIDTVPQISPESVDYGGVIPFKMSTLNRSFLHFKSGRQPHHFPAFDAFCHANSSWLDDFALFVALKEAHSGVVWTEWEPDIAQCEPHALERWKQDLADSVHRHKYFQYLFHAQWSDLRREAHQRGIRLIGDVPIFVAHDSADVWANPEMFYLDGQGMPTAVAGVPPDYFSATGQLWGNPLYRWDRLKENGYAWWIQRIRSTLRSVDLIRLDHFRGFEAYWEVPAGETTAVNGRWVKGPGDNLFRHLQSAFGEEKLPLIAEDLGVITNEVVALREAFGLPGMKILQFSFSGGVARMEAPYLYPHHCVVYTGTHDNDTALGWLHNSSQPEERELALKYMGTDGQHFHWDFIRLALSSVANTTIIPLQDVLGLGSEARMNYPSRAEGNWQWRFRPEQLSPQIENRLGEMTEIYGRSGDVL